VEVRRVEGRTESPKTSGIRVLLSTCPQGAAEELASYLVANRLAACVNIIPQVLSVYRWEDAVHKDAESLLVIKCPEKSVDATIDALVEKHPYDVPEVISLIVEEGNPDYLSWVIQSTHG
jgi:periplasmic divalent cation tolerance protein